MKLISSDVVFVKGENYFADETFFGRPEQFVPLLYSLFRAYRIRLVPSARQRYNNIMESTEETLKTGFYKISGIYGVSPTDALECDGALGEIFSDPGCLMVGPIWYMHGACDVFAWYLSREYGYGIRAYHTVRDGYQDLLVHAMCFSDYDGMRHWIDVRGITDDVDEMLEPFLDDIDALRKRGYDVVYTDYDDVEMSNDFVGEFIDPMRDLDTLSLELDGLIDLTDGNVYRLPE